MAEFLITEAVDVDSVNDDNNEGKINTATVSDKNLLMMNRKMNQVIFIRILQTLVEVMMMRCEILKMLIVLKLVIILIVMKRKRN